MRCVPLLSLVVSLFLMSGCTYQGGIDQAATIKPNWYSYLNGDDVRAHCWDGALRRYRLVYNADYDRQVRTYEIIEEADGRALLTTRVIGGSGIVIEAFSDLTNLSNLGGWDRSQSLMQAGQLDHFDQALQSSGAFEPAPQGLRLYSDQSYWISALCRDGVFSFNAWLYPSQGFDALTFPGQLFALDGSGIKIAEPKEGDLDRRFAVTRRGRKPNSVFEIRIGKNGLLGLPGY